MKKKIHIFNRTFSGKIKDIINYRISNFPFQELSDLFKHTSFSYVETHSCFVLCQENTPYFIFCIYVIIN